MDLKCFPGRRRLDANFHPVFNNINNAKHTLTDFSAPNNNFVDTSSTEK